MMTDAPQRDRELAFVRGVGRRLPPLPHATALINRVLKPWYLRKERPQVVADVLGFRMRLNPAETTEGALLFYPHLYDRHEIAFLRGRLQDGDTFLDVGANVGY